LRIEIQLLSVAFLVSSLAHAEVARLSYAQQEIMLDGQRRTVVIPRGYRLEFLSTLDSPRMLAFAANGDLFAGSKSTVCLRPIPNRNSCCASRDIHTASPFDKARC
jgi:hypothetical protein